MNRKDIALKLLYKLQEERHEEAYYAKEKMAEKVAEVEEIEKVIKMVKIMDEEFYEWD